MQGNLQVRFLGGSAGAAMHRGHPTCRRRELMKEGGVMNAPFFCATL